ncbi:hypothetical protein AAE478_001945 [Parahypoxylon ruwenzoriense]
MPTYLCHGFRWHRRSICYFVVIQNVDDAAPEWIVARQSSVALLDQFYELFDFLPPCTRPARNLSPSPNRVRNRFTTNNIRTHTQTHSYAGHEHKQEQGQLAGDEIGNHLRGKSPKRSKSVGQLFETDKHDNTTPIPSPELSSPSDDIPFNDWSVVKFLEEFDPSDLTVVSGPWAYVADYVVRIDTSVSVAEEISRYEAQMKTEDCKPMSGPSDESGRKVNTFGGKKAGWFEQLRDQLQRSEAIRWYVVVCGDEERATPEAEGAGNGEGEETEHGSKFRGVVENGFEFRLPEFLVQPQAPESRPRRRVLEKGQAEKPPTSLPKDDQLVVTPPPSSTQVDHKMDTTDNSVKSKTSKSGGRLRRLFLKRHADNPP